MKTKYKIAPFYLDGLKQKPKDLDFGITPSLVFAEADKEEVGDLGFAYAIGIKWGYWAIGLKVVGQSEQLKCPGCELEYDKKEIEMFRGLCESCRDRAF